MAVAAKAMAVVAVSKTVTAMKTAMDTTTTTMTTTMAAEVKMAAMATVAAVEACT